jgi:hypothetical protein
MRAVSIAVLVVCASCSALDQGVAAAGVADADIDGATRSGTRDVGADER